MRYEAIGFDYGGVIKGKPNTVFRTAICEMLDVDQQTYLDAYFRHNEKVNVGNIEWTDFWGCVLEDIGQPDKLGGVMALSKEVFGQPISTEMLELVDSLRQSGLKAGLLSNNTMAAAQRMRENGIEVHFDVFHVSGETGLMKPSREAFEFFAEKLKIQMGGLIFIDDSESSLSTAEECGYTPVLFTSYDDLIKTLAELKVL